MLPWLSKRQTSKKASVIAEQKCEKFFKGKLKNRSKLTNHEKGAREHINYLLQVNPRQTRGEGRKGEGVGVLTTQCLCALGANMLSQLKLNDDITRFERISLRVQFLQGALAAAWGGTNNNSN